MGHHFQAEPTPSSLRHESQPQEGPPSLAFLLSLTPVTRAQGAALPPSMGCAGNSRHHGLPWNVPKAGLGWLPAQCKQQGDTAVRGSTLRQWICHWKGNTCYPESLSISLYCRGLLWTCQLIALGQSWKKYTSSPCNYQGRKEVFLRMIEAIQKSGSWSRYGNHTILEKRRNTVWLAVLWKWSRGRRYHRAVSGPQQPALLVRDHSLQTNR